MIVSMITEARLYDGKFLPFHQYIFISPILENNDFSLFMSFIFLDSTLENIKFDLISLSIMHSRYIHVTEKGSIFFFLIIWDMYVCMYICIIYSHHSSVKT